MNYTQLMWSRTYRFGCVALRQGIKVRTKRALQLIVNSQKAFQKKLVSNSTNRSLQHCAEHTLTTYIIMKYLFLSTFHLSPIKRLRCGWSATMPRRETFCQGEQRFSLHLFSWGINAAKDLRRGPLECAM